MRGAPALPDLIRRAPARLGLLAALLAPLAACEAPARARFPISEAAAARPVPELAPTARFARVAETSSAAAGELEAGRAELAARAEALRAAQASLSAPVLDAESRARLTAARETGIALPAE